MIDTVVRYLRDAGIAFRLVSYPSPEPLPAVESAIPAGSLLVRTQVIVVGPHLALACARSDVSIDPRRLSSVVNGAPCDCWSVALNDENDEPLGPIPPLAGFFGVPLFVDDEVPCYGRLIFRVFAAHDYVEIAYADLAWLEHPYVAALRLDDESVYRW